MADGDKETCACLAAAQCGAGGVCNYDCSCGFPCDNAAEQVVNTLQSMGAQPAIPFHISAGRGLAIMWCSHMEQSVTC